MWSHIFGSPNWIVVLVMVAIVFGGLAWLIALDVREAYRRRVRSIGSQHVVETAPTDDEIDPPGYRERISVLTEARDD